MCYNSAFDYRDLHLTRQLVGLNTVERLCGLSLAVSFHFECCVSFADRQETKSSKFLAAFASDP